VSTHDPQDDTSALVPFAAKAGLDVRGADGQAVGNRYHVYYEASQGRYYRRAEDGDFIRCSETGARRFLRQQGLEDPRSNDSELTEVESALEELERRWWVEYAGPIAGRRAGWYVESGQRVLVTHSPQLIKPVSGKWNSLCLFLEELLGDEQKEWLLGWLHWALAALYANRYRAGQVVVLCGPRDSGKTLLASLITEMLGGRSASPLAYLTGKTDFNGELAGAVHLLIDDDWADSDPRVRRQFGAHLRGYVAARTQRLHPKNKQALSITPLWRVSMLLNDDPSSLTVLPQLEESIQDKITLLKATKAALPADDDDPDREEKIWRCFTAELPALVYYLLHEYRVRDEWRNARFGLTAMHNPAVLELIEPAPEEQLLELIDGHYGSLCQALVDPHDPVAFEFEGPARFVEKALIAAEPAAKRLFWATNQCGLLLGKIEKMRPQRVSSRVSRGVKIWRIERNADN